MIDSYQRAILYHLEAPQKEDRSRRKLAIKWYEMLTVLEGEMFKDGYYKAFVFLAGHCDLCEKCGKLEGKPCKFSDRRRPSMEASGIDVYQTARNNDFFIKTLREKMETWNIFCLMLVD
jgi:predicted metal-binding protein